MAIETRQHSLIMREPPIGGVGYVARVGGLIGVAEQHGVVTGAAGEQRDVVEAAVERGAVGDHPVVHLIHARVQTRAAWRAWRALAVVVGKSHASVSEAIEVRRLHQFMASNRKAVCSKLVERYEQDI